MDRRSIFAAATLAATLAAFGSARAQGPGDIDRQIDRLISGSPRGQGPGYGPWNNDLIIATSSDGIRFTLQGTFVERGGVASIAEGERGRLLAAFQWFPIDDRDRFDKIAVRSSDDGGKTWTHPVTIEIEGMPEYLYRAFDPTIVAIEGGRWRLYFTSERAGRRRGNRAIFSAVSGDGIHYTFEEGMRFGFESEYTEAYDCAVARIGDEWHLYAPAPGKPGLGMGYHAVSRDGLTFERLQDVQVIGRRDWLGCALAVDGGLRFYGSGEGGWAAFSKDGAAWSLDAGTALVGADPGVARNRDGLYVMIATGPLRKDAKPEHPFPSPVPVPEPVPVPVPDIVRPVPVPVRPAPSGSIAANESYVYVLRGDFIYQYEAKSLQLLRKVRVEDPETFRETPTRR